MCLITWAVWSWGWPARLLKDGAGSMDGSAVHLRGVQAACGGRELDMLRTLQVSTEQKEWGRPLHCKKRFASFPSPARVVTTKLSLGGNNDVITELFLPGEFG
jgi:hypothetical protein